ncbi:probable LRR receptor-like serine/threonine-protein kinase At3g47570 [Vigna unguiculata]|uniref:probable LRR receptor-like serine/threonine-protein kinase At3g47570 n=1 Tax=Vigna unguiculata TaxID=3917 RepID=UPI001016F5B7|nr:probable LRR receptor-like serine/threonine-protein kinase At3g47570 [Vigna unguiculata]
MKYSSSILLTSWSICAQFFSLFTINTLCFTPNAAAFTSGNETDNLALLKFKDSITDDPHGIFLSWNTSTHFCNWYGVTCNSMFQRVTHLNLQGYNLKGFISPHVANLSFMTDFNIANNSFHGKIPQELGLLSQLQKLSLLNNSLVGEIPTNLTGCAHLTTLLLNGNNLNGKIPVQIASLPKLQLLALYSNQFTGGIPSFLGNISSLIRLSVASNNLEGNVPQEICRLKSLTLLSFSENKLSGTIPLCVYNMSSLTVISATENQFNGSFPPYMFNTLSNLQVFYFNLNQISGSIPPSITNASNLSIFEIGGNSLTGGVPSMGKLQDLYYFVVDKNFLGESSSNDLVFLESLTNCTKLNVLDIAYNNFGSHLPNSLGNLSTQLTQLYFGGNQISGEIPAALGNLIGLSILALEYNFVSGKIPTTFGKFQKMQMLNLGSNKLSGDIKSWIGNLSQLFHLEIGENMLQGNIPPSVGNCQKLQYLDISNNNLSGIIPIEIFQLSSLTNVLDLSENSLSGSIPKEVANLKNLNSLYISDNHLSGVIPESFGECIMLEQIYLQGNSLQGSIPSSLASLKGLEQLDLSRNQLSGSIPKILQTISFLEYLNVSFNMLNGEVPTEGVFRNASGVVISGNSGLCGGISKLHLPSCPVKGKKLVKHKFKLMIVSVIVSVVVIFLMLLILTIYWMRKKTKKASLDSPTINLLAKVSYQSLYNATDGFSVTNLIGCGISSSVYRGTLELEDKVVAIKVLNLKQKGSQKSFLVECNALRSIRHRNLVQILTCCSGTDYKGQEFKALIFEYMRNGSLEQWLHPMSLNEEHPRLLSLDQRLNIIIDVATALNYLHHDCEPTIIHCDLKPSNVLLDDDMIAHVTDFGIARFLSDTEDSTSLKTSTIGIKGTIGYAPPEYGMSSEVSTLGDMYSFGILVLEILTGKRPTDKMFEDGLNLHNFVSISFPSNLLQILDPRLIQTYEATTLDGNNWNLNQNVEKCIVSLFMIGLACSEEPPKERMNVVDLTKELSRIKRVFSAGE